MTYILDLQRLWGDEKGASQQISELRKNVVSVIVIAEGDEAKLMLSLQSVLVQKLLREVIIVNCESSASIEKSLIKFASLHPKCYVVSGQRGGGLASAYNLGAQYASGQYLLFLSENSQLPKNTVPKLLATGLCKPTPWVIGVQDSIPAPLLRSLWCSHEGSKSQAFPEVSLPGGGFHVASVAPECLFIATQTFLELKGMDRKCFHSTFHKDLCLRVHLAGGGVYRARDLHLVIGHHSLLPVGKELRRQWQAFKGMIHFYKKYVSGHTNIFLKSAGYVVLILGFLRDLSLSLFSFVLPRTTKASNRKMACT